MNPAPRSRNYASNAAKLGCVEQRDGSMSAPVRLMAFGFASLGCVTLVACSSSFVTGATVLPDGGSETPDGAASMTMSDATTGVMGTTGQDAATNDPDANMGTGGDPMDTGTSDTGVSTTNDGSTTGTARTGAVCSDSMPCVPGDTCLASADGDSPAICAQSCTIATQGCPANEVCDPSGGNVCVCPSPDGDVLCPEDLNCMAGGTGCQPG